MTPPFSVHTTPHFDRSLKKLIKRHPNLGERYAEAIEILNIDPQKRQPYSQHQEARRGPTG
jgi:mRNA-degrading endonuclease YafQ of YafQ-DinJ toxin-antitoxin module